VGWLSRLLGHPERRSGIRDDITLAVHETSGPVPHAAWPVNRPSIQLSVPSSRPQVDSPLVNAGTSPPLALFRPVYLTRTPSNAAAGTLVYAALDLEITGLNAHSDRVCEAAVVRFRSATTSSARSCSPSSCSGSAGSSPAAPTYRPRPGAALTTSCGNGDAPPRGTAADARWQTPSQRRGPARRGHLDGPPPTAEQGGPGIQSPDRPGRDTPPTPPEAPRRSRPGKGLSMPEKSSLTALARQLLELPGKPPAGAARTPCSVAMSTCFARL
jgi:hypothetical protein